MILSKGTLVYLITTNGGRSVNYLDHEVHVYEDDNRPSYAVTFLPTAWIGGFTVLANRIKSITPASPDSGLPIETDRARIARGEE